LTLHVPLVEGTKNLINAERIGLMPESSVILNFSRGGIVANEAVLAALDSGRLSTYVTDFPDRDLIGHEKVIGLPHLGASTNEAESNCAVMVADSLRNYLEHGIIRHSVNFPEADIAHTDSYRLTIANENVPNMVGQISTVLGDAGLNINDLLNKSRGDLAYTIVDLDAEVPAATIEKLESIAGVLCVRNIGRPNNVA
jgi:D-3-phosphoglycerate dehydrogenase